MPKSDKIIERERAYWNGELVTILDKGRRSSTIRTSRGFVEENVPNRDLDFDVEAEKAKLRFQKPTG